MKRCFIGLAVFLSCFAGGCATSEYSGISGEHRFTGCAYNPCNDEWVFWLAVPYGSAELGMERVPANKVSFCLRKDGRNSITVRFFSPADKIRRRYSSAIILVPNERELSYWQEKLQTGH